MSFLLRGARQAHLDQRARRARQQIAWTGGGCALPARMRQRVQLLSLMELGCCSGFGVRR